MLDLKTAYQVLELPENASSEELEKRFELLLRRARAQAKRGELAENHTPNSGSEPTIEEIREAYNFIIQHSLGQAAEQVAPKSKLRERIDFVWEYYKWHMIGGLLTIIVLISFIGGYLDGRKQDRLDEMAEIKVRFFTSYAMTPEWVETFNSRVRAEFPDYDYSQADNLYSPIEITSDYDMAYVQKAFLGMSQENRDVLIIDKDNFEKFAKLGAFMKLSEYTWPDDIPEGKRILFQSDEDTEQQWYAVDITGSKALEGLVPPSTPIYAVIHHGVKEKENAVQIVEWLSSRAP